MKLTSTILTLLLTGGPTYTHAKTGVRGGSSGGAQLQGVTHGRNLRALDEACIAAVTVVDYEDNSEETFLACELGNGNAYKVPVVGPDWIKNNMKNGQLKSGRTFLNMPGAMIDEAKGEIVTYSPPGLLNNKHADRDLRELATVGTRSVLVVRVIAGDGSTSSQESGLSESVFNDPVCLASQFDKCSQGKLQFVPTAPRSKGSRAPTSSTDISSGATTVTIKTATSQGSGVMVNDITIALNDQFGVTSPRYLADHVMYCLPAGTMTGIAYATVNSWRSVYSNEWCTFVSSQMHEIGHNIGLAHSHENGVSYDDQTGMMGYSYGLDDGPSMCFNGAKLWQLGWFTGAGDALELNEADLPVTLNLEGFVTPNTGSSNGKVKVVKINTSVTDKDVFVVFNWQALHNSGTAEGGNQVTIVQQGAEGNSYSESSLLAKLSNGNSYTANSFFGTGKYVTVTVTSLSTTDGTATVHISGEPVAPTPPNTPAPTPQNTPAPTPPNTPPVDPTPVCGNGVCEADEDCTSCPGDCAGVTKGKPSLRYCCAGGPSGCNDIQCTANGSRCSTNAFSSIMTLNTSSYCGDGECNDNEDATSCPSDCDETTTPSPTMTDENPSTQGPTAPPPPSECGDGSCSGTETCLTCPSDCDGILNGQPKNGRFCCVGPQADPVEYGMFC